MHEAFELVNGNYAIHMDEFSKGESVRNMINEDINTNVGIKLYETLGYIFLVLYIYHYIYSLYEDR